MVVVASRGAMRGEWPTPAQEPLTMLAPGRKCAGCGNPLSRYNRGPCFACQLTLKKEIAEATRKAEEKRAEQTLRESLLEAMPGMAHELMERTGASTSSFYKMISRLSLRGEIVRTGTRGRGGRGRDALGGYVYHRAPLTEETAEAAG